jgi:acetyl esterase/lipase
MRTRTTLCAALLTLAAAHLTAQIEELPLRAAVAGAPDAPPEEISFRNGGFDDRGFNRVVRKISVPTLTVYHPAVVAHRGATCVVIAGGGYDGIVIDREGHAVARWLQAQGILAGVLKYRLPDASTFNAGRPAPQQDALAAIRFVREHAREWKAEPARVGVIGASAGGHLAGSTAVFGDAANGSRPDFVVMLYPVVTLAPPFAHAGSRQKLLGPDASAERIREFSLEQRVYAGLPPFFLAQACDDKTVPIENSAMLADALKKAAVPVEFFTAATGGHGFALGRGAESARWKDRMLAWLDALP